MKQPLALNIFVSHAHAQATLADELTLALRQEGHEVFLDRDALKAGDGFHAAIREAIGRADLLLFLVSPQALESDSYALAELDEARKKWLDPTGRVLPVMVAPTPFEGMPPYLKVAGVMQPQGDLVAATLGRVAEIRAAVEAQAAEVQAAAEARAAEVQAALEARRKRRLATVGGLVALSVAAAWSLYPRREDPPRTCKLEVRVLEPAQAEAIAHIDVVAPAGTRRGFFVIESMASIEVTLTSPGAAWTIEAASADGRLRAAFTVTGCPAKAQELTSDEPRIVLRLSAAPA